MLAALGQPPDAIVFTDAIGETEPEIRTAACKRFKFLGLKLNSPMNAASRVGTDIATAESSIRVLIIKARENWQIARESLELESTLR
jgi:acetate kinase